MTLLNGHESFMKSSEGKLCPTTWVLRRKQNFPVLPVYIFLCIHPMNYFDQDPISTNLH